MVEGWYMLILILGRRVRQAVGEGRHGRDLVGVWRLYVLSGCHGVVGRVRAVQVGVVVGVGACNLLRIWLNP